MMLNEYAKYAVEETVKLLAIDSPTGYTAKAAEWVKEAFDALGCKATFHRNPSDPARLDKLTLRLSQPEDDGGDAARLVALLQALPRPALAEVEFSLLRPFDARIDPALAPDDYIPEVLWPWET